MAEVWDHPRGQLPGSKAVGRVLIGTVGLTGIWEQWVHLQIRGELITFAVFMMHTWHRGGAEQTQISREGGGFHAQEQPTTCALHAPLRLG